MKNTDISQLMGEGVFNLDSLITATPSCLKVISKDGSLLNMNQQGLDLIEAENLESVLGADVYEIVEESHREKFMAFNQRICSGESDRLVFEIVGLQGTKRWMETYAAPYKLTNGETAHIAITNDISEKVTKNRVNKVITEIRKNYIKFKDNHKKFFDFLLDEIIKITESEYGFLGEIIVNDQGPYLKTYAITDISWNEETKKFYEDGVESGLVFSNLKTLFGEVIKTGKPMVTNEPKAHPKAGGIPKGHPPLNAFFGMPIYNSGELLAMVGVANRDGGYEADVVEYLEPLFEVIGEMIAYFQLENQNKKNEIQLIESNKYLDLALEGANLGIWDWYLEDNSVKFDRRWAEMLGINFETIKMELNTWESRVHPDDLENCYADIQAYMNGETEQYKNIHRMKHENGEWVYILDQGKFSDWDESGKPIRFTGTHFDISDQKKQEQEMLEARDKAQNAEKVKSQFLANMSHEIRTPMNGILGMLELLEHTELTQEQREMVNIIGNSGSGLMIILNDILDLSKIESGKFELESIDFSIKEVIDEVVQLYKFKIDEKELDLKIESEFKDSSFYKGDFVRIKQILGNLLSNAIKFTSEGTISVRAFSNSKDEIEVVVKDTGIGISEADQKRLFEDFLQADNSTTRKFGGTGLGLSISKKLAHYMGGRIELKSSVGEGSEFKFIVSLPKVEGKGIGQITCDVVEDLSISQPLRILLVEDNKVNQKLVTKMLEKFGYSCEVAGNGQEAIDILKKPDQKFDLVYMDMQMPILDGLEATKKIRSELGLKDLKIVALTANVFSEDRQKCDEAGMDDFLGKPVTLRELKRTLLR